LIIFALLAGIAQLVERNLAKVDVAGSSPVSRSVPSFGIGTIQQPAMPSGLLDFSPLWKYPVADQSHQATGSFFATTVFGRGVLFVY
jgi:hypothetical protein